MVADSKKVQTMINIAAQQMETIRSAVDNMEAVRTAFQLHNPEVAGTPLQGKTGILSSALDALRVEVNSTIWTELISAIVPSHRNKALE